MLPENPTSYDDLKRRFKWRIPARFNIGVACSDVPAAVAPGKAAIIDYSGSTPLCVSFSTLAERSSRFASAMAELGIGPGDRVAIMLPQCHEAVVAHLGVYKLGAIVVPLAMQFGPEAMMHRLQTAGVKAFVGDMSGFQRLDEIRDSLPALQLLISIDETKSPLIAFDNLISAATSGFLPAQTTPDDPAMMLFTSGTTGQPKGALHGHRVLLGHLPGIQMAQGFMPKKGDLFWTPSDWAWAGGLLNALLPALYFGVTVVAARAPKFDPDWAVKLIKTAGIRNVFMPATAIKLMQSALTNSPELELRTLGTAGEALGGQTLNWARETLGLQINEFYGQTECNAIISACHEIGINKAGSMGKGVPGHEVAILGSERNHLPNGEIGEIAIRSPNPVMFLEYWNDPEATAEKFNGNWMMTGDRGWRDRNGYFHFVGRNDDVITSAGYRIGPAEIEDCLTSHPAVELAAVVGKPDPVRTEIVCANIKLASGYQESDSLETQIRNHVKNRLSAHEYPREINFVGNIPLTESGKVIRRHFRA